MFTNREKLLWLVDVDDVGFTVRGDPSGAKRVRLGECRSLMIFERHSTEA